LEADIFSNYRQDLGANCIRCSRKVVWSDVNLNKLGLEVLGTSEIKTSRVIIGIQQDAVTEWLLRLVSKTNVNIQKWKLHNGNGWKTFSGKGRW
jgi:hypothetical protein